MLVFGVSQVCVQQYAKTRIGVSFVHLEVLSQNCLKNGTFSKKRQGKSHLFSWIGYLHAADKQSVAYKKGGIRWVGIYMSAGTKKGGAVS